MADRAKLIQLGVSQGITDLDTIRNTYNQYAEGGFKEDYLPSYNYVGYALENPGDMIKRAVDPSYSPHYVDTFKTAWHPTFSSESIYSGKVGFLNPKGIRGGDWGHDKNNNWVYRLSEDQMNNNWNIDRTVDYLEDAEDDGVVLMLPGNHLPVFDVGDGGERALYNGVLPNVTVEGKRKIN